MVIGIVVLEKIFQQWGNISAKIVIGAIMYGCWKRRRPHPAIAVVLIVPYPAGAYHHCLTAEFIEKKPDDYSGEGFLFGDGVTVKIFATHALVSPIDRKASMLSLSLSNFWVSVELLLSVAYAIQWGRQDVTQNESQTERDAVAPSSSKSTSGWRAGNASNGHCFLLYRAHHLIVKSSILDEKSSKSSTLFSSVFKNSASLSIANTWLLNIHFHLSFILN